MPYILKQYEAVKGEKIENFLLDVVKLSPLLASKLLAKGRIIDDKKRRLQKGHVLKSGFIEVCIFEAVTKGLTPIFQTEHFAVFDKPSGLLVHPVGRSTQYTLLDEIKFQFGDEGSLIHRIDCETSGLVLVSKNEYSQMVLNSIFENREVVKKYRALVEGEISQEIKIEKKITNAKGLIKIKMQTSSTGKESTTLIKPIKFDKAKNKTIVEAIPYTGRQHQIRVHLESILHRIVGDPIYGVDEVLVDKLLKKQMSQSERIKITGNKRLMLHAYSLEFTFLKRTYNFCSQQKIFDEMY